MRYELGICTQCRAEGETKQSFIVNKRHNLCQYHNRIRLNSQRDNKKTYNNRSSQSFSFCTCWGFATERDMFEFIWNDRPHVSEFTGKPIQSHPASFLHILAKGLNQYPYYRFNPDNIMLGTIDEHYLVDNGTDSAREKYAQKNPQFREGYEDFLNRKAGLIESYRSDLAGGVFD